MGAPSIDISFIEKGISAATRGERGIVMLWVKDTLPASAANPATVVTESDIPAGLSDTAAEQVRLAMAGYTNAPKKVLVYGMGIAEDADTAAVEAGYKKAMDAAETTRFDYLAVPTVGTDGKGEDVASWVKAMRGTK